MTRNTRGDFGIATAADRQSMRDGRWQNDTRKTKWTVDVEHTPPHLQIIESLPGGSRITAPTGAVTSFEETLFVMKHGMPFPPAFLCFFYTKDVPPDFSANIGQYQQNRGTMLTNAAGIGEEGVYAMVDDEYFYIKHFVETFGFGVSGDYTFFGNLYDFRVRFELLNHKAHYTGSKY